MSVERSSDQPDRKSDLETQETSASAKDSKPPRTRINEIALDATNSRSPGGGDDMRDTASRGGNSVPNEVRRNIHGANGCSELPEIPAKASQWDAFGTLQGWVRSQTGDGPVKYRDLNNVVRITIKRGSPRAPGSGDPHVELRNEAGKRIDPYGNEVTRKSAGNHTPIEWDW